jgi:hypothetical protein
MAGNPARQNTRNRPATMHAGNTNLSCLLKTNPGYIVNF